MTNKADDHISVQSKFVVDFIYKVYRQGILAYFENCWLKYGDLIQFKVGRQRLFLVANPKHIRHILISKQQKYGKLGSYKGVRKLLLGNGLFTSNGAVWKQQRRLISPSFTPKNVQHLKPLIISSCDELTNRWDKFTKTEEPVEIVEEMLRLSSTIILKATFSLEMTTSTLKLQKDVDTMFRFSTLHEMNPFSLPLWFPSKKNRNYFDAYKRVDEFIKKSIHERKSQDQSLWPSDFLTDLMLANDKVSGEFMSDEILRDELVTIFFAGHETTARTLAFLWYGVSQSEEVEKKLHLEVDNLDDTLQTNPLDRTSLNYTARLIKETLRLYVPAPFFVRDTDEDDLIDGMKIPKGSTIMLFPYLTHRHKDYWKHPLKFDPDRWLPENEMKREPDTYFPFGLGKRTCLGNHFALYQMQIIISHLSRHFYLKTTPNHVPKFDMEGTLISRNGLPMTILRRSEQDSLQKVQSSK